MTSPKKLKVEVEGFIHEVSDVKEGGSRKKYFTAVMQEAKKHTKMVIFSPQRHNWFKCAEKDESPVKVENIILSPSRQKQGDHDILVNDKSRLTCVRDLSFVFDKKPYSDVHLRTLSDILADPREHQRVNVVVKIMEEREKGSSVTRSNKTMNRTSYAISDKTASILITIWGDDTLRIDKWYEFKNVSVRFYNSKAMLSTTMETTFAIVEDAGAALPAVDDDRTRLVGNILQVAVTISHLCPRHHQLDNVNTSTLMTKCEQCKAYCKTSKLTNVILGKILLEDADQNPVEYTMHDDLIRSLVTDKNLLDNEEKIVTEIMQHDMADVTARRSRALFITFCEAEPKQTDTVNPEDKTQMHPGCQDDTDLEALFQKDDNRPFDDSLQMLFVNNEDQTTPGKRTSKTKMARNK